MSDFSNEQIFSVDVKKITTQARLLLAMSLGAVPVGLMIGLELSVSLLTSVFFYAGYVNHKRYASLIRFVQSEFGAGKETEKEGTRRGHSTI